MGVVVQVVHFAGTRCHFERELGGLRAHCAQIQRHTAARRAQAPFVEGVIALRLGLAFEQWSQAGAVHSGANGGGGIVAKGCRQSNRTGGGQSGRQESRCCESD